MATDIHWIIERRHRDGAWEAVGSGARAAARAIARQTRHGGVFGAAIPGAEIGARDYALFGALSLVRGRGSDPDCPIAVPGFPPDRSAYARDYEADTDLHTHGLVTLPRLRADLRAQARAARTGASMRALPGTDADRRAAVERFLTRIETAVADPEITGEVLPDSFHTRLPAISNHERLRLAARHTTLLPPSDATVRVLIAYDS